MNKYLWGLGLTGSAMALMTCTVMQSLAVAPTQLRSTLKRGDDVQVTTSGRHDTAPGAACTLHPETSYR